MKLNKKITNLLIDINSKKDVLHKRFEIIKEIKESSQLDEIDEIIVNDLSDVIPFDIKKTLYERIIELNTTDTNKMKEFAWWLQLNGGPDHDGYARVLLLLASSQMLNISS
jgi:hypothetical protein